MVKSGVTPTYRIPLRSCALCSGRLVKTNIYNKAKVYGFHKPRIVNLMSMKCIARSCRRSYGPNWLWSKGTKNNKHNMVKIKDLQSDKRRPARPLFVSTQCGFDLDYLEYHLHLLFRNGTGWRAAGYAAAMVYPYEENADHWRQKLSEAIKYYLLVKELTPLGLDRNIVVGSVGKLNLKKYREHVQGHVFPMDSPDSEIVVVDGHSKARPEVVILRISVALPTGSRSYFPRFATCINPNNKTGKRAGICGASIKSPCSR